jgi:hypothetical protein
MTVPSSFVLGFASLCVGVFRRHLRLFRYTPSQLAVNTPRNQFANSDQIGEEQQCRWFIGDLAFALQIHAATIGVEDIHGTKVGLNPVAGTP